MNVLVDSSVWIEYFRGGESRETLDGLIDEGLIAINELILAELVPFLIMKKQRKLVALLEEISCLSLQLDWQEVIQYQLTCLQNGICKVGIPDLIIAQNAIQHGASILTLDKHFRLMAQYLPLQIE